MLFVSLALAPRLYFYIFFALFSAVVCPAGTLTLTLKDDLSRADARCEACIQKRRPRASAGPQPTGYGLGPAVVRILSSLICVFWFTSAERQEKELVGHV